MCVQAVTGTSAVCTVTQTSFFVLCVQAVTGTSAIHTVTQTSFLVYVCAGCNRNICSSHSYSDLILCICVCRLEQEHQQCPGWLCLLKLLSMAPISISWNWLQRNIMLCSEYHFICCHDIRIQNMWHHLLISYPLLSWCCLEFSEAGLRKWMPFISFCTRSHKKLQLPLLGQFQSRCCCVKTMEVESRIEKQYKCLYCCVCKNYRVKVMEDRKKWFCIIFWLTRRSWARGKNAFLGILYNTSNKFLLVARHTLTAGFQKSL